MSQPEGSSHFLVDLHLLTEQAAPFAPFPLKKLPYYYRGSPSLCPVLVLSSCVVNTPLLPSHQDDRFSCSIFKACAEFMPAVVSPETRHRRNLSRKCARSPILTAFLHIDTSSVVHLHSSLQCSPDRFISAFSLSLTTTTLNNCRIGRFGSSIWIPKPRGLPSSLIQQGRLLSSVMTHERSGIATRLCGCWTGMDNLTLYFSVLTKKVNNHDRYQHFLLQTQYFQRLQDA